MSKEYEKVSDCEKLKEDAKSKLVKIINSVIFNPNATSEFDAFSVDATDLPLIQLRAGDEALSSLKNFPGMTLSLLRTLSIQTQSEKGRQFLFLLTMMQINQNKLIASNCEIFEKKQFLKDQQMIQAIQRNELDYSRWFSERQLAIYNSKQTNHQARVSSVSDIPENMQLELSRQHYLALLTILGPEQVLKMAKDNLEKIFDDPSRRIGLIHATLDYTHNCHSVDVAHVIKLIGITICHDDNIHYQSRVQALLRKHLPMPRPRLRVRISDHECIQAISNAAISLALRTNDSELLSDSINSRIVKDSKQAVMLEVLQHTANSRSTREMNAEFIPGMYQSDVPTLKPKPIR